MNPIQWLEEIAPGFRELPEADRQAIFHFSLFKLVHAVLRGENTLPRDCVIATLTVVYRLRNNLFHGVKWAYGIQGQLDNFINANSVLMSDTGAVAF